MTGNRSEKKVFMLAACCAAIIFGGYMTFFYKEPEEDRSRAETQTDVSMSDMDVNYLEKGLPAVENETAGELYTEEGIMASEVYFTNTELLDKGKMPLEAQAVLAAEIQAFLDRNGYSDVTELYMDGESYIENEKKISFLCFMDGHKEALQIEYSFQEQCLKYYILPDGADTGEGYGEE